MGSIGPQVLQFRRILRRSGTAKTRQTCSLSQRGLPSIFDLGYEDCLDERNGLLEYWRDVGSKIIPLLHHSSIQLCIKENIYGLF